MDDQSFARLLDYFDASWRGYRKVRKGVKKRVSRHMQDLGCPSIGAYLERLDADPSARAECERRMGVSVSRFFRDLRLWSILAGRVLPELLDRFPGRLRVWFAGCACGEEVYSFKMLWADLSERFADREAPRLIATDIHPQYLDKARAGIYNKGSLKELSTAWIERFFEIGGSGYAVRPEIKQGICWQKQHLVRDPPPASGFHMIFLRNSLLTYYIERRQIDSLSRILTALLPEAFLIIGNSERLPGQGWGVVPVDRGIYKKSQHARKIAPAGTSNESRSI